ncbi:MAG: lipoyl synthase [bacterium]
MSGAESRGYGVPGGGRKPPWIRVRASYSPELDRTEKLIRDLSLHTVCDEATCPNRSECFGKGTATFMILGDVCTRNCTFCDVAGGEVQPPDPSEPKRVAEAASRLGLNHAVVTSVTRDDLPDGGAGHFARVIRELKAKSPDTDVEVLIPDFLGSEEALRTVLDAVPDVLNHNLETVPRLYPEVRPEAGYRRSLDLLHRAKRTAPEILTKSGIMLGLGEEEDEVTAVLEELRAAGCDIVTIGQYLAPSKGHHPVVEYVFPEVFERLRTRALDMGFRAAASGPFVRSSYHAAELVK